MAAPAIGNARPHARARHRRPAGIVRRARRPAGWAAPGPAPTGGARGTAPLPRTGEDLCYLAGDWRIFQRLDGHRWSLDDLVTAWVAAAAVSARRPARLLDLGCGIGSVLLLLAWRFPDARCMGIEAQRRSVDLARRSIAWNGVQDRCGVICGDFRISRIRQAAGGDFDLVAGTPPYLPPGTATPSNRPQCRPCRFEDRGGIEAYCRVGAATMAASGRFVTCMAWPQDERTREGARRAGLAVTQTVQVVPREGKAPLFAVYVMTKLRPRAALPRTSFLRLVVRDSQSRRTAAFRRLRRQMGMPP
jgi:tRNA1(Val) A37 N6-methylase TrmN6